MKPNFDSEFFQKRYFSQKEISRYLRNALKDLKIASTNQGPEVIFDFSYSALIKCGVSLLAACGYRVRSRKGHHIKILEKLSQILDEEKAEIIGDRMRKKRNMDLYEGGILISTKEARDYLHFVREIIQKTEQYLQSQDSLF